MTEERSTRIGRPRDQRLDQSILDAAIELMAEGGLESLSIAEVADRADTSRPSVYRRYDSKEELAVDALASLSSATAPQRTGDHLMDLTRELASFRDGITRANSLGLAANVLLESTDPGIKDAYRRSVVEPRRSRIRSVLEDARAAGMLHATADQLAIAVTMCTGSWYAHALAGVEPPGDWPEITAELVWKSLGG